MATITAIRAGLAANLAQLGEDMGFQVSPYSLSQPTPPAIQIYPGEILYDQSMHRGLDVVTMVVQAFVTFGQDKGSQMRLDDLLDPTGSQSLKAAIEKPDGPDGQVTLGGLVADVSATSASGYRISQGSSGPILVCEWTVIVYAQN